MGWCGAGAALRSIPRESERYLSPSHDASDAAGGQRDERVPRTKRRLGICDDVTHRLPSVGCKAVGHLRPFVPAAAPPPSTPPPAQPWCRQGQGNAAALRPRHACRMRRARRRAGSAATATAAKDAHSGRRPNAWRSCSASFGAWPSGGTGSALSVALAACTENKRRTRKQRRRHERARACEREREP